MFSHVSIPLGLRNGSWSWWCLRAVDGQKTGDPAKGMFQTLIVHGFLGYCSMLLQEFVDQQNYGGNSFQKTAGHYHFLLEIAKEKKHPCEKWPHLHPLPLCKK